MSLAPPTNAQTADARPEPDYAPDEAALMLYDMQLKHLIELRGIAMDAARDVAGSVGTGKGGNPELAIARIGKLVLQICAMEQHTVKLRARERADFKMTRTQAKKAEVTRAVQTAVEAAESKAGIPARASPQRLNLLRDILKTYDFSDPRTVAAMVADVCGQLGVPFKPDIWPAGAAPVAEDAQAVETAPAEAFKPAGKPAPSPGARRFDGGGVSAIGLMAQAPAMNGPTPPRMKTGRDPP